jgi:hypothetical protein
MPINHTVSFIHSYFFANSFKTSHKVVIYWLATCYSIDA